MTHYPPLKLERLWEIISRFNISAADFKKAIEDGLWTPGITLGEYTEAYFEHENDAMIMVRANEGTNEEIRALVKHLVETRKVILADITEPLFHLGNTG